MLSPQALVKGLVSRVLPSANVDSSNTDVAMRQARYGELFNISVVRKSHVLADEGTFFCANNAQTGVAMTTTIGFSATAPFVLLSNNAPVGGVSLYVDSAKLITTVAGSAASGLTVIQGSVSVDTTLRYSSGGTQITNIVCPNAGLPSVKSVASLYYGAITATAASGNVRNVVGLMTLRPTVSATVADVVGEMKVLNFGGVEGGSAGTITVASANIVPIALPPIVVPPQGSALIYVYYAAGGTPVAAQYALEMGWWER